MASLAGLNLPQRIGLLVLAGLVVGLGLFSWLGIRSLNESTQRILDERLTIARVMASHLDETLAHILVQLQQVNFGDGLPSREQFAPVAYSLRQTLNLSGIFTRNIILTNRDGLILQVEPDDPGIIGSDLSRYAEVKQALATGQPTVSGLISSPLIEVPVVFATAPIFDDGKIIGGLTGAIDIEQSSNDAFSPTITVGETGYMEIVDSNGIVLARSKPGTPPLAFETTDHPGRFAESIMEGKATVMTCHRCHETGGTLERRRDVLAFAPLSTASWGIAIRQSEEEALAPTHQLGTRLLLLGIIVMASSFLLVWMMMQGIVKPIRMLTAAAKKVAAGDFNVAAPVKRRDEIGQLSTAFDTMTRELARSRDELLSRNEELAVLYEEAKQKEELRGQLLSSVINAQEEERKRIARELHDEHGQTLTGVIMSLESLESVPQLEQSQLRDKLKTAKSLAIRALEDMRRLTLALRPSALDDLGLTAAIRAYAQTQLEAGGVQVALESQGMSQRLTPAVETALFRIIQEAIHNIAKHAEAQHVRIQLTVKDGKITVTIEDDGRGFDVEATFKSKIGTKSLGLLGIKERTSLLGGTLTVTSRVGHGTQLRVEIPTDGSPFESSMWSRHGGTEPAAQKPKASLMEGDKADGEDAGTNRR